MGDNIFSADVKAALPMPSFVFVGKAIVGFIDVFQQTPFEVILTPPLSKIIPPLNALIDVTFVAAFVVKLAIVGASVVKVLFAP